MLYQDVDEVLEDLDADLDAAEAHGMASGMLSVAANLDALDWLHEILGGELGTSESGEQVLLQLFERTRAGLADFASFTFELFLPDAAQPLFEQAEALGNWCRGYLFGLSCAAGGDWPRELAEITRDMSEFSRIDSRVAGEEDAAALMEVCEYIRVAVFTIREHFQTAQLAQG